MYHVVWRPLALVLEMSHSCMESISSFSRDVSCCMESISPYDYGLTMILKKDNMLKSEYSAVIRSTFGTKF